MTDKFERDLGRVEGKLDALITTVSTDISDRKARDVIVEEKFSQAHKRISKVENRQYYFMGAGGVVGSILTFLAQRLTS